MQLMHLYNVPLNNHLGSGSLDGLQSGRLDLLNDLGLLRLLALVPAAHGDGRGRL